MMYKYTAKQNKALLKRLEGLQAKCDALKQKELRAEVEASVRSSLQVVEVQAPSSSVEVTAAKPTVSDTLEYACVRSQYMPV
jgi:hypothetical protein